ncbi:MAG: tetratricopeptide repeat protein [Epsilonproteobacteria bacterium]|nr:tetratricopeptide repeat protein [Campylobacterota bacterium]
MAEEEEVIILEEESGQEEADTEAEEAPAPQNDPKKRKQLYLLLALSILVLLLALLALYLLLSQKNKPVTPPVDTAKLAKKIASSSHKPVTPLATPSEIESMIKKANILYERGEKKEALALFEQIAAYSASVSYYNLGVAQMRQEKYAEAIESFKKAIQNGENRAISALNAAACSLHLHDRQRFDYYIRMAEASLPESYGSSLYSYLYALINFYKGNYYEILSALKHPMTRHYTKELGSLGAIAYTVYGRSKKAIGLMEADRTLKDPLFLGLLYARIGDYDAAARALQKAMGENPQIPTMKALALVRLKNRQPQKSAKLLRKIKDRRKTEQIAYPIHVALADTVTSIDAAQKRYSADALITAPNAYRLIFEFAPFKVFNAAQTINYIRKGNASIYVDEAPNAAKYLTRSSNISHVNLLISQAIKEALDHRLRRANRLLQKALKRYPNHSILHYNLGLTYAQLGEFGKAHDHFLRSYHLNTSNYLSGIFALICENLIHKTIPQVARFIQDDLKNLINPTLPQRYLKALYYFYKGNIAAASQWLDETHDNRPAYLLLDLLIQAQRNSWPQALETAKKLRDRLPRDILANLLYLDIRYRNLPVKSFSAKAIAYLKRHPMDLDAIYYGSSFTRVNYITLRHITGTLYPLKKRLEQKLIAENEEPEGIIEALALVNIYLRQFEEAYTLLNQLVDKYNRQDSRTLFLTAVAAIAADHHATAAALLELAKLTDPNNLESRYALGLLYLEQENLEAAAIQFNKIPDGTFHSRFFDFDVTGYKRNLPTEKKR